MDRRRLSQCCLYARQERDFKREGRLAAAPRRGIWLTMSSGTIDMPVVRRASAKWSKAKSPSTCEIYKESGAELIMGSAGLWRRKHSR